MSTFCNHENTELKKQANDGTWVIVRVASYKRANVDEGAKQSTTHVGRGTVDKKS